MNLGLFVVPLGDITTEIGHHLSWGPDPGTAIFGEVLHLDTMWTTLLIMVILIVLALLVRRQLTEGVPGPIQSGLEAAVEFINGTVDEQVGAKHVPRIAPMALTFALFILLSNWIGLVPTGGLLKSPTADINTTLALALVAVGYAQWAAIRAFGLGGWLGAFFRPVYLGPIEVLIEFTKPITLAFRLFGNIAAGEIMLIVIGALPLVVATATIPTIIWLAFSVFVGVIQAFIFMMLTIAYYGQRVAEEH